MDNSYSPDLITLLDEDGLEHNFEILDIIEENDTRYYALMPVYENGEDLLNDTGHYTILEAIENGEDEELAEVVDETLRKRLSRIFEERFDEMFYDN